MAKQLSHRLWVGVTKPISSVPLFFQVHVQGIRNYQNTSYRLKIMFMFDRCHHSLAVVTPAKYEYDSKDLMGTFCRIGNIHNGGINERSFSNPHPCDLRFHLADARNCYKISVFSVNVLNPSDLLPNADCHELSCSFTISGLNVLTHSVLKFCWWL